MQKSFYHKSEWQSRDFVIPGDAEEKYGCKKKYSITYLYYTD